MKAKFYLLAGLSTIMLGACNDDLGSDTTGNKTPVEGEGVMHLNLNFPGMSANTRAQGDQEFEPGTGDESQVNNATVYYFDSSDAKKYLGQGVATNIIPGEGDNVNIESTLTAQVPANVVKEVTGDKHANIIVVLNKPEGFFPGTEDDTYTTFNTALETADDAGFMMSSVNYYPNGTETYFTEITETNIKEEGEPVDNAVVEVYVERVCAKVKLKVENPATPKDVTVKIHEWGLNVRNKTVYPVKQLHSSFTGLQAEDEKNTATYWPGADDWTYDTGTEADPSAVDRHRCFWAKDPNYSDADGHTTNSTVAAYPFKVIQFKDLTTETGDSNPLYCLENTFDQEHQDRDETTTAVFLAQYIPTKFEEAGTLSGSNSTWVMQNGLYYTLTTYVNNFLATQNIYTIEGEVANGTANSATENDVTFKYDEATDANGLIGARNFSFAEKAGTTVYRNVEDAEPKYQEYKTSDWEALNTAFKTYIAGASIYVNGYCYYEIPIRHFTDHEVKLPEDYDGTYTVAQLGRYGVVRNHCYELTVTQISKPGKPIPGGEVPITPEEGPDDPTKEHNITVKINILEWAVRSHVIEL